MIALLNNLMHQVMMDKVAGLKPAQPGVSVTDDQVQFGPPDDAWRNSLPPDRNALSVYLVDIRDNRKLRSNERVQRVHNGMVYEQAAPARLDCHYLISAYSPAQLTTLQPTLDEHALLYEVAAVLMQAGTLNPTRVYPSNSFPLNAWPVSFRNVDLPLVVAPADGFPKLAEFWGTMGQNHRWKPVLYLIVTIPVELVREFAGYMVTTRITEYRIDNQPDTAEVWVQIGGHVFNTAVTPQVPIAEAWVGLETATGESVQATQTNELGRFTFGSLRPGHYQLRARVVGLGEKKSKVEVPTPTGVYDVRFP